MIKKYGFKLSFGIFFAACIIGWIYEVALGFIYGLGFENRGFLFGPYLPIYGIGAIIIIACFGSLKEKECRLGKVNIMPFNVFWIITVVCTVLEYIAAVILENLLDKKFWDYSDRFLNFQGRISFRTSITFGFIGIAFLYIILPIIKRLYNKLSPKAQSIITYSLLSVMLLDFIIAVVNVVLL